MGAVCGQTGVQTSCAARAQIAADVGCCDQHDLRLLLHNDVADNLCVSVGGVGCQCRIVANVYLISTVCAQLLSHALDLVAQQQAANLYAHVVSQLACLAHQLQYGRLQLALALLAEHPYAGEIRQIGIVKFSHC